MKYLFFLMAILMGASGCQIQIKPLQCGDEADLIKPVAPNYGLFRSANNVPCTGQRYVRIKPVVTYLNYIGLYHSTDSTNKYIKNLTDNVAYLFAKDGFKVVFQEPFIYTSPDPYTAYTTGSTVLNAFATAEFAKPEANTYDLAILIDRNNGANNKANYAYLSGLNPGYYSQKYAYVCVPLGPNVAKGVYDYKVKTIAHELGHSFGSRHTQWCGWEGGPIDSCSQPEAVSGQTPCRITRKPNKSGTIMSYCDLDIKGGIDFSKGFGPKPKAVMMQTLAACTSCPCEATSPCLYTYSPWGPCRANGTQSRTIVDKAPTGCTGMPDTIRACQYTPPSFTTRFSGTLYNTTYLPMRAIDGNHSTRWLTNDTATVEWTSLEPISTQSLRFLSGYQSGANWVDGNRWIMVWADGQFIFGTATNSSVDVTIPINRSARKIVLKTFGNGATGAARVSRIRELVLK